MNQPAGQAIAVSPDDGASAAQLAAYLKLGGTPSVLQPSFRLLDGESLFASMEGGISTYEGADVVTPGSSWIAVGSPLMLAGTLTASALVNRSRKRKAQAAAAPQWREQNRGVLHVTSDRLILQGIHGWLDFHYEYVHAIEMTAAGLVMHFGEWPLIRIACPHPMWTYVAVSYFSLGNVIDLPYEDRPAGTAIEGRPVDPTGRGEG